MSHKKWIGSTCRCIVLFAILFFPFLHATPPAGGIISPIVFGQSAFLGDGSLQLYGELIRNAINARFNRVNKQGGIAGRNLNSSLSSQPR